MGKKNEDICVPRECSPKAVLSREDFNNQVSRVIHSVDSRQLFPQLPLSSTNGLINKATLVVHTNSSETLIKHQNF